MGSSLVQLLLLLKVHRPRYGQHVVDMYYWLGKLRWLAGEFASLTGVLIATVATVLAFMPNRATRFERWADRHPAKLKLAAGAILCLSIWGYLDNRSADQELRQQIKTLVSGQLASTGDMDRLRTDVAGMRDDVSHLRDDWRAGVDRIVNAIMEPTSIPPVASTSTTTTTILEPAIARHVHYAQRRVPSDIPAAPYGTQVILQTDVATQPTRVQITLDGPISEQSRFFVAGHPATMNHLEGVSGDRRTFILGFDYPAWTPESPIVATIYSAGAVSVVGIEVDP